MLTVPSEAIDQVEWYKDECLMLQDEIDCVEVERDTYKALLHQAQKDLKHTESTLVNFRRNFDIEVAKKNNGIALRAVALSNLVDEYQRVLDQYISLTGTKLVTNKLIQLRERGGYPTYDD
jgi:hypothetical protein